MEEIRHLEQPSPRGNMQRRRPVALADARLDASLDLVRVRARARVRVRARVRARCAPS